MIYLPTEPDVILAQAAMAQGCDPECWHCRAHARMSNIPFPFTAARALALAAVDGPLPAVGDRPAASGGAQGRGQLGSARPVQAPLTLLATMTEADG